MPTRLRFGRFELRPDERRLLADGRPLTLGPRALGLLVCLVERRGRVVSKRDLLQAVWPEGRVDEGNLTVQASALRKLLGPDAILTIAGQGYRFALPVTCMDDDPAPGDSGLAVLPLEAPPDDPQVRIAADALVEDVVALLARTPDLLVISSDSSAQFASCTAADAAGQLGVRHVAEGRLAGQEEEVTLTARLSDAGSGFVLWTGRLQAPVSQLHELQLPLAHALLAPLRPQQPPPTQPVVRLRGGDAAAWAAYRSAVAAIAQGSWSEPALQRALQHLQQACAQDPAFPQARAHQALLRAVGARLGFLAQTTAGAQAIAEAAAQAAADNPGCPQVLALAGSALAALGHWDAAQPLLDRALQIHPGHALAHVAVGVHLCVQGDLDAGLARMRLAIRLSPRDRRLAVWSWLAGNVLLRAGRLDAALEEALEAARRDPQLLLAWLLQADVLQRLARDDDALAALQRARHLRPQLTLAEAVQLHGEAAREALAPLWLRAEDA